MFEIAPLRQNIAVRSIYEDALDSRDRVCGRQTLTWSSAETSMKIARSIRCLAHYSLGLILQKARKWQAALNQFEIAQRLAPTPWTSLLLRAGALREMGRLSQAWDLVHAAFEGRGLPPLSSAVIYGLSQLMPELEDAARPWSRAPETIRRPDMLLIDSMFAHGKPKTGKVAMQRGDYKSALRAFEPSVHEDPSSIGSALGLASARAALGELEGAAEAAHEAVRLEPYNAVARMVLASVLARLGELNASLQQLQEAAALSPDSPEPWEQLGWCLLSLGRAAESQGALERAIELGARSPETAVNLGEAMLEAGNATEAVETLKGAVLSRPDRVWVRRDLAAALLRAGAPEAAEKECQELEKWNRSAAYQLRVALRS